MRRASARMVPFLVALLTASTGLAATRAYFVEPKTAANGWTPEDEYVGQTFVANVDSIAYIEWFVGELSAEGVDNGLVRS